MVRTLSKPVVCRHSPPIFSGYRSTGAVGFSRADFAFTLVELLVVVAILGLLAALILPALGKARVLGRKTECVNNFRQWHLAMQLYVDDHEGFMPRESFGLNTRLNLWSHVGDPLGRDVWFNALPPYLSVKRASDYWIGLENRREFYRRGSLFHCPAAKFPTSPFREPWPLFSMAMNSQMVKLGLPVSIRELCRPSDTVLFLDNRLAPEPLVDPAQPDFSLGQPSASPYRFVTRHGGLGNLVFWDGHAGSFRGTEVVESRPGPLRGDIIFPEERIVWNLCPQ